MITPINITELKAAMTAAGYPPATGGTTWTPADDVAYRAYAMWKSRIDASHAEYGIPFPSELLKRDPTFPGAEKAVISITITGATTAVVAGTVQYTAVAHYSDFSSGTVTTTAAWHSATTATATIGAATGLATAVAAGTTAITAVLGGVTSNTITLTVTAS